jgi:hypothetical protein
LEGVSFTSQDLVKKRKPTIIQLKTHYRELRFIVGITGRQSTAKQRHDLYEIQRKLFTAFLQPTLSKYFLSTEQRPAGNFLSSRPHAGIDRLQL